MSCERACLAYLSTLGNFFVIDRVSWWVRKGREVRDAGLLDSGDD
jgi:hypothetical protein